MKTIFYSLLLLASTGVVAQQIPAAKGDLINYEYSGKKEKITMQLPKGAETKPDGKFVINGKNFHIEEVEAQPYLEKATTQNDTVKSKRGKDIKVLSFLFPERTGTGKKTGEPGSIADTQMRVSEDNESMSCWYSYNEADKTMITKLEGGKVIGDKILIVVMDDKITAKSIELKKQRALIFEILDSAVPTPVKKAR